MPGNGGFRKWTNIIITWTIGRSLQYSRYPHYIYCSIVYIFVDYNVGIHRYINWYHKFEYIFEQFVIFQKPWKCIKKNLNKLFLKIAQIYKFSSANRTQICWVEPKKKNAKVPIFKFVRKTAASNKLKPVTSVSRKNVAMVHRYHWISLHRYIFFVDFFVSIWSTYLHKVWIEHFL